MTAVQFARSHVDAVDGGGSRACAFHRGETPSCLPRSGTKSHALVAFCCCARADARAAALAPASRFTAVPAAVMQVPPSGLFDALSLTSVGGILRFRLRRRQRFDHRPERNLADVLGEILLFEEVEERRVALDAVRVEVAADGDAASGRRLRGGCWTMRSNVPGPRSGERMRSWVSWSPSSVILTPFRPNGFSRPTISGVSGRPFVIDVDHLAAAARLGGRVPAVRPGSTSPAG